VSDNLEPPPNRGALNPSTALARVLVDELVRAGVREAVLSPGSRSAPLAMALHAADADGRLRLHVRVDERSAGFLALGLAKGSHRPVPVVTTSGTAVVNLHPAVLEARHAGVPIVVLSADRPAELRGTGANQTTDQVKVFGSAVVAFAEIPAPDVVLAGSAAWRTILSRLLAAAMREPGPAHLDVAFRDPLLPDSRAGGLPVELHGRPGGRPWTQVQRSVSATPVELALGPRTVVVAGDDAGPPARQLAEQAGWPLLAEASSGARTGAAPIAAYRLLLDLLGPQVQRVVTFGHPTLSRPVSTLLARTDIEHVVVTQRPDWVDAGLQAARVLPAATVPGTDEPAWAEAWQDADRRVAAVLDDLMGAEPLGGLHVAREVSACVPPGGLLFVGASQPARDLDLVATAHRVGERRMVMANRGLAGIDGAVSTAVGLALARRPTRSLALMGDLTFLHDRNGLLIGPGEPRPDLTLVVVNDDGGAIFSMLEQGGEAHAEAFERVFGTPTGADLAATCRSTGVPHRRVDDLSSLQQALATPSAGVEVLEVQADRDGRRDLDLRVRQAAAEALAGRE
jgi:2-succinyl-5-enolpyruvyl-6-hydroxy-3-cyclohexene-1-carboxylate synthase